MMKIWRISFQYWMIVFTTSDVPVPEGYVAMDDADLDACLRMLTIEKRNVWVRCRQGMRRVVSYMMAGYRYIKAAGGIVENERGERLLIMRNGHWDMAKGKVEPGETLREAALREVNEETGLTVERIGGLWLKSYHIYDLYGGWHLKQTSWYTMPYEGDGLVTPQEEEGIVDYEWVTVDVWKERLGKSFSMLRLVSEQ